MVKRNFLWAMLTFLVFTQARSADAGLNPENQAPIIGKTYPQISKQPLNNKRKKLDFIEEDKESAAEQTPQLDESVELAESYFHERQYEKAIKQYRLCAIANGAREHKETFSKEQNMRIAGCCGRIGSCYSFLGNYERAIEYFNAQLSLAEIANLRMGSECYQFIALCHKKRGNYVEAAKYIDPWHAALIKEGKSLSAKDYQEILVRINFKAREYKKAAEYADIWVEALVAEGKSPNAGDCIELIQVYNTSGESQKASDYIQQYYKLSEIEEKCPSEAECKIMAGILEKAGKHQEAARLFPRLYKQKI